MNRTLAGALAGLAHLPAAAAAHAYSTPFGAAAPWNVPAARWAVDPDSDNLVRKLWCGTGCGRHDGAENLNLTTHDYSFPVYYTADATGTCPVKVRRDWGSNLAGARVPCSPAWKPSTGRNWGGDSDVDAQMIVLDAAT